MSKKKKTGKSKSSGAKHDVKEEVKDEAKQGGFKVDDLEEKMKMIGLDSADEEDMKKATQGYTSFDVAVSEFSDIHLINKSKYDGIKVDELLTLALLTTKGGWNMLQLLTDWDFEKLGPYTNTYITQSRDYKQLTIQWRSSLEFVSVLSQYLINNESTDFDISKFCQSRYKVLFSDFIKSPSKTFKMKLLFDPSFNLMVEYMNHARFLIENMMKSLVEQTTPQTLPPAHTLVTIIRSYDRVAEFNGSFLRYNLPCGIEEEIPTVNPIFEYLAKLSPSSQPIIESLTAVTRLKTVKDVSDAIENGNYNWIYGSANELPFTKESQEDDLVYSFELDQNGIYENRNIMKITELRHEILFRYLNLDKPNVSSTDIDLVFKLIAGLVDPLTQPSPTDALIISIDQLYLLFLFFYTNIKNPKEGKLHSKDKFMMCMNLMKVIKMTTVRLLCDDFDKLKEIDNFEETDDWKKTIDQWVPRDLNTQDLELIYMIDIMCIYTIYKTYENEPLGKNPFLFDLYYLWKCLTKIVYLGLQIDRLEEAESTYETPLLVRATVRGCAALRSVLATVLNDKVEVNDHDFKHEPFNTFMSPHGRKLCNGALVSDMRTYIRAFIENGIELDEITNLLLDLTPGDRFDEDIEYMFDYEYEDYNDVSETEDEEGFDVDELNKNNSPEIHRRCNCVFENDKIIENIDKKGFDDMSALPKRNDNGKLKLSSTPDPYAVRARSFFDFTYGGKDWRDIPRGLNLYYNPDYDFSFGHAPRDAFERYFEEATTKKIQNNIANIMLVCAVACIKSEQDHMIIHHLPGTPVPHPKTMGENIMTTEELYDIVSADKKFEKLLYYNNEFAWCLMDEMLMSIGYRRVLIWLITHLRLNHTVIHYIFELVMGYRCGGTNSEPKDVEVDGNIVKLPLCEFSRQGTVILSEIETQMLLQEFFLNAAVTLSDRTFESEIEPETQSETLSGDPAKDDHDDNYVSSYALGLVGLICTMVKSLISAKKLDVAKSESTVELQTFLLNWISYLPAAKDLYFELKETFSNPAQELEDSKATDDSENPDMERIVTEGEDPLSALYEFLDKNPVNPPEYMSKNTRKIIYKGDRILPLQESEKPISHYELFTYHDA